MTNIDEFLVKSIPEEQNFPLLLDTLAQPVHDPPKKNVSSLKKRAYSKKQTIKTILPLIDQNSSLKKSYWNTHHCNDVLLQHDQTITGKYCNNRWCLVCNRIRTAKLIKGYLPVINSEFKEPTFVTLTIPNVSGEDLRKTIKQMIKTFILINRSMRRTGKGIKGIRKIEVTYSLKWKNYHPHFHFLVEGADQGNNLVNAWLEANPEADHRGQDVRKADLNSLIELFKYSTKMTVEESDKKPTPPEALDLIFQALYKLRTYQPINVKKIVPSEDIEEIQAETIEDIKPTTDVWNWEQELDDWINAEGEFLTEYVNNVKAHEHEKANHWRC